MPIWTETIKIPLNCCMWLINIQTKTKAYIQSQRSYPCRSLGEQWRLTVLWSELTDMNPRFSPSTLSPMHVWSLKLISSISSPVQTTIQHDFPLCAIQNSYILVMDWDFRVGQYFCSRKKVTFNKSKNRDVKRNEKFWNLSSVALRRVIIYTFSMDLLFSW